MYYLIYQITNKTNGMIYVGKHQTENKNDDYMGSGKYLKYAIEKEGIENFEKTILFECQSEEEMNQKEAEIVNEEFVHRKDTYNVALGGDGGWYHIKSCGARKGGINCQKKFREKGKTPFTQFYNALSEDEKQQYNASRVWHVPKYDWTGNHHTEETKQKMHEIHQRNHHQQGEKNSNYGKHLWKDPNDKTKSMPIKEGDSVPEGWIRGRWVTEDTRIKISNINKGKIEITNGINVRFILSDEPIPNGWKRGIPNRTNKTRQKLSEIAKINNAKRKEIIQKSKYETVKLQYDFWLKYGWKAFVKEYHYPYSPQNFYQTCKNILGSEYKPKFKQV